MRALSLLVLLARLVAPVSGQGAAATFTFREDLQTALELVVCFQNADWIAHHGAPDSWDVSAVTDMTNLIGGSGIYEDAGLSCKSTFNEVRTLHI